ncbi:MAG: DNA polymerase IV, partial [Candidatus Acetothermia bacterium]|nr:DNA polymerase IV [Candidatus Acetothermia bacterium]
GPQAVFLRPRFARYQEVSQQIRQIFYRYTPLVEPISLDEAFLDLSGTERLLGPAEEVAREVKQKIREETGLTCSVGLAPNKFLAKLASDLCKPDGFLVVHEGEEVEFLKDLPIERLWGVGEATARRLRGLGISTIGDLQGLSLSELLERFGRLGSSFYKLARGIDRSPVVPDREARSLSQERTFPEDIADPAELKRVLVRLSEEVAQRLRAERLKARTVQLKVRLADFSTITRATTLDRPTALGERIWEEVQRLFSERVALEQGVRLLGVQVSGLVGEAEEQLPLFQDEREARSAELERLIDELRARFGEEALKWGRDLP